jgi:peptidylprolyl isomerase
VKFLALIGISLALTFAACGGSGSDQATSSSAVAAEEGEAKEATAKPAPRRPLAPTVVMSKAKIAKLPPLTIPRQSGPPPRHLKIVDLRKGSGPGVPKNDLVTNREKVFIRYFEVSYPVARKGPHTGQYGPRKYLLAETVEGLARALPGMKVGGRREIIIPPRLVYPRWRPSWGYEPYVDVYLVDLLGMEPPPDSRVERPG